MGVGMTEQERPHNRPVKVYVIDKSIELRAKQAAFVYEYLKDYNATQAAIRAGYSKRSAGTIGDSNMQKDVIVKAIDDGKWFYQYQNGIDADWIRKERIKLYKKCITNDKEVTAKGLLADMAKDAGMDIATVNVNQSGTINHEVTVKDQMNFDAIRQKVDKHKDALH